jgi:hypothetical protein
MMGKLIRTLKGFNPYRVAEGVELDHSPRVSPLAVEFLPFREKSRNQKTFSSKVQLWPTSKLC